MADTVDEAGAFWLPSQFFDDFLMDEESHSQPDSDFSFPAEFPYNLEIGSEKFLNKQWVMSTSPQSTLVRPSSLLGRSAGGSSSGSPNAAPSPPMTPSGFRSDAVGVGDLITQAAGQVAKLKLNDGDGLGPTKHILKNKLNQQKPWSGEPQTGAGGMPVHPNPARIIGPGKEVSAVFGGGGGGAAVKKGRAGTGVFLPRKYGNINNNNNNIKIDSKAHSSDSRKKTGYPSSGYVPDRAFYASNRGFDGIDGFAPLQPLCHSKMSFVSDYDLLMARRNNALMLQQQRLSYGGDYYLPKGWTY